jgi:CheY-like chemotaxis protein
MLCAKRFGRCYPMGEASDFRETIQKSSELHPDLIILDLNMPDRNRIAKSDVRSLLNGAKVLAITLGADDMADELLDSVGAVKVLDKMDLADQLILAILELAPAVTSVLPAAFLGGRFDH